INRDAAAELSEIQRISSNLSVVIDSERTAADEELGQDREDFVKVCETMGIGVKVLDRRATENYFTEAALTSAFGEGAQALGPFDPFRKPRGGWAKRQNW